MQKVKIDKINDYNYILIDKDHNIYEKNIEFYCQYIPQVGDIIYLSDDILRETNLYAFDEIHDETNLNINDVLKVVSEDKKYYFQRIFG